MNNSLLTDLGWINDVQKLDLGIHFYLYTLPPDWQVEKSRWGAIISVTTVLWNLLLQFLCETIWTVT